MPATLKRGLQRIRGYISKPILLSAVIPLLLFSSGMVYYRLFAADLCGHGVAAGGICLVGENDCTLHSNDIEAGPYICVALKSITGDPNKTEHILYGGAGSKQSLSCDVDMTSRYSKPYFIDCPDMEPEDFGFQPDRYEYSTVGGVVSWVPSDPNDPNYPALGSGSKVGTFTYYAYAQYNPIGLDPNCQPLWQQIGSYSLSMSAETNF